MWVKSREKSVKWKYFMFVMDHKFYNTISLQLGFSSLSFPCAFVHCALSIFYSYFLFLLVNFQLRNFFFAQNHSMVYFILLLSFVFYFFFLNWMHYVKFCRPKENIKFKLKAEQQKYTILILNTCNFFVDSDWAKTKQNV